MASSPIRAAAATGSCLAVEALMQHDLAVRARGLRVTNAAWWSAYNSSLQIASEGHSGEGIRVLLERYKRRALELDDIIRDNLRRCNETQSFRGSRGATQADVDRAIARKDHLFVHAALGANVRSDAQCEHGPTPYGTLVKVVDHGYVSILETVLLYDASSSARHMRPLNVMDELALPWDTLDSTHDALNYGLARNT